jgi:hypothetical protein
MLGFLTVAMITEHSPVMRGKRNAAGKSERQEKKQAVEPETQFVQCKGLAESAMLRLTPREGPAAHASIQNNSGLPQGPRLGSEVG